MLKKKILCSLCLAIISFQTFSQSFIVREGETATSAQVMNGSNETGEVQLGGRISTIGDGIISSGSDAVLTNSGVIETTGFNAIGITTTQANALIANHGLINTVDDASYGIFTSGDDANIINTGSVTLRGASSTGIESLGSNVRILNSGIIDTLSIGIFTNANNAQINNIGKITTTGTNAHGIMVNGASSYVRNTGSIITTGQGADSIWMQGINSTIDNSGSLSATGDLSYAIRGSNGKQTLNILRGSNIRGRIDLVGNNDADEVNFYGSNGSAVLTIDNAETINLHTKNAMLINPNKIIFIDITNEINSANSLDHMTSGVHFIASQRIKNTKQLDQQTIINNQLQISRTAGSVQSESMFTPKAIASSKESASGSVQWANFFTHKVKADAQHDSGAYEQSLNGVVMGTEPANSTGEWGVLWGVARGHTAGFSGKRVTDTLFMGLYSQRNISSVRFNSSIILGQEAHELERNITDNNNGVRVAKSKTTSIFFSPSATLSGRELIIGEFKIVPSLTTTYSIGRFNGYTEIGADEANITMSSRSIKAFSARTQLAAEKELGLLKLQLRAGTQFTKTKSSDAHVILNGNPMRLSIPTDDDPGILFLGVHAYVKITNNATIRLDVEFGKLDAAKNYANGNLLLKYIF